MNKTCFNGLYRVNNAGEFNSPFGKYRNPNIVNEPTLKAVSAYLNANDIQLFSCDYKVITKEAQKNSFVYLDPPYHPLSQSSNFTGYVQGGWDEQDQIRLKEACDDLTNNSASNLIKYLYNYYKISIVRVTRCINSDADKRGEIDEYLIRKKSYDSPTTVTRLNNLINKRKSDAMAIILKLHEADQLNSLSVTSLKDKIANQNSSQSF